jgi:CelD/BcsL family acetyltransferase involved in cellulose biosynthesis
MLSCEPISLDTWQNTLQTYPDRTIHHTPAWLSFVAQTQHADPVVLALQHGTQTVGHFTGLQVQKYGVRVLGSPFQGWTTSYMGFCLSPDVSRRAAVEAVLDYAFRTLGCLHVEIMDRSLQLEELSGLQFAHRFLAGFEIDLTQSEESLFANMSSACRRAIRKAEKNGVVIEEASGPAVLDFADDYYTQLLDVFAKQQLVPSYGVERVRQLIEQVHPTGMLLLLRARNPDGRCIATGIFPAMHDRMYFWGGASLREYQILRPNELLQYQAMTYWKARGIGLYDMGGSGEYKRKYGGYEIAVPWVRKSKYAFLGRLRDTAAQLQRTRQRVLGKCQ